MGGIGRRIMLSTGLAAGLVAAAVAQRPPGFHFDPQPSWAEEQETEAVCKAIASECAALMKDGSIDASWGYAECTTPAVIWSAFER